MATMKKVSWAAVCKFCKGEIKKGEVALFEPGEDHIETFHVSCPATPVKPLLKDGGKNGGKP